VAGPAGDQPLDAADRGRATDGASVRELGAEDTTSAWLVLGELRPALDSLEGFTAELVRLRDGHGYRLVGAFEGETLAAVAGFHLARNLAWGLYLYVDDLVTREACRRRGHGTRLLAWLEAEARRLGCRELHLDSGLQRTGAHAFYAAHGLEQSSLHFRTTSPGR